MLRALQDIALRGKMKMLIRHILLLKNDERGVTAVEYGLILSLIFLAMIGALTAVSDKTIGLFNDVSSEVANSVN